MLNIVLIGCGGMGNAHRQALHLLKDRARVVAVIDPDLDRARKVAETLGCDRIAFDYMDGRRRHNVSIRFANGALGYHFGIWGAQGTRLKYSFHAHCTDGMLEGQISQGRLILYRDAAEEATGREQLLFETEPGRHVHNELIHFVECIENRKHPTTDGMRSLQSLRVIWKLYEAEQHGVVADLRDLEL